MQPSEAPGALFLISLAQHLHADTLINNDPSFQGHSRLPLLGQATTATASKRRRGGVGGFTKHKSELPRSCKAEVKMTVFVVGQVLSGVCVCVCFVSTAANGIFLSKQSRWMETPQPCPVSPPLPLSAPLYFHQQSPVHRGGLNLAAHHENQFTGETGMTEYISTTIINSHPTALLWIYIYFSILFTVTLLLWAI